MSSREYKIRRAYEMRYQKMQRTGRMPRYMSPTEKEDSDVDEGFPTLRARNAAYAHLKK